MSFRLNLLFGFYLIFFVLILIRLFSWQVLSYDFLGGIAEKQRQFSLPMPAERGKIFASDGSPLVINQKAYSVYLERKKIIDLDKTILSLSHVLEIPVTTISAKLKDESLLWVEVASKIEIPKMESLKKLDLAGVKFIEDAKRFYPEASMAAHLLGFVGKNTKGEDQGYFGLEGYYDDQLRGRSGLILQEKDALGNPIIVGKHQIISAEDGRSLTLHLDKTVQYIVERQLKEKIEKYQAKGGSVVVMEPKTGAILAMASIPTYDPGLFNHFATDLYKNPAVSLSFEPGSTFKTVVMAMAVDDGKVDGETKFIENGPIEIGGYTIKTWNQKYHGEISMTDILKYSSNVGMVFVVNKLERNVFYRYLEDLGLGKLTGIDLQDESSPILRSKNSWYEIDYATASFGQGIAVTPIQMVRAVAAIANGGNLVKPQVVKSILLPDGRKINIEAKIEKQIFKPKTARMIAEMMAEAVSQGESKFFKPTGYRIAGKTGTAQVPIAGHYDKDKTIASFVGFVPVIDPKFLMLVAINEPKSSPWGSETAAPLFFAIASELFTYFSISPDE